MNLNEDQKNQYLELINNLINKNTTESLTSFEQIVSEKVATALQNKKEKIASGLFEASNKHREILNTMDAYKNHSELHAKHKAEGNHAAATFSKNMMKSHATSLKKLFGESTEQLSEEITKEISTILEELAVE